MGRDHRLVSTPGRQNGGKQEKKKKKAQLFFAHIIKNILYSPQSRRGSRDFTYFLLYADPRGIGFAFHRAGRA